MFERALLRVVLAGVALVGCERGRPPERDVVARARAAGDAVTGAEPAREPGSVERRIATCAEPLPLPCEILDPACQERIFELAVCAYGQAGRRPELRFVSEPTLAEERAAQRARSEPLDFALQGLDLAAPREEPRAGGDGPTFTAFYTPRAREIWAFSSEAVASDADAAGFLLLHEYIHALQDAGGGLAHALETRRARTFDADLALYSAVEGEATFYEEAVRAIYYGRRIGDWVPPRLALRTRASDEAIVRQRFPLVASFAMFPYTYGANWAARGLLDRGVSHWLRAQADVLSTREVMADRHGWESRPSTPCLEGDATRHDLGRRTGTNSLGAWLMQAYVRKHTRDGELAQRAARDLRGDVLTTYAEHGGERRGFVWVTCFGSEESASALHDVLGSVFAAKTGTVFELVRRGRDVVASVSN
jgi:hypothetical protein